MCHNIFLNKKNKKMATKLNLGFGLVELLVSISIMILVIGVVLSQHNAFNGAVLLRGQAYDIALQTRDVQMKAVSVKTDGSGAVTAFRKVYGLHFDTGSPNTYDIFLDGTTVNGYTVGEELGKQGKLDPRFEIVGIDLVGKNRYSFKRYIWGRYWKSTYS